MAVTVPEIFRWWCTLSSVVPAHTNSSAELVKHLGDPNLPSEQNIQLFRSGELSFKGHPTKGNLRLTELLDVCRNLGHDPLDNEIGEIDVVGPRKDLVDATVHGGGHRGGKGGR